MKEYKTSIFHKKVIITLLTPKFAIDLMSDFILANSKVLNQGIKYWMLQAVKLVPHATKIVAYHTEDKCAIGFLCLEENNEWLYSIKYVFVDPKYRKMGLATRLLTYSMNLAKEKGAKKVNLNVYSTQTQTIDLYRKRGFKEVGATLLGQGSSSGFATLGVIKRTSARLGHLIKFAPIKKCQLFKLPTNSRKNRETLFSIYQRCVDQKWIDFFEINANNLINGSRHVWQPSFFKEVLINESANFFALIFNRPFFQTTTVELYSTSHVTVPSVLEKLLIILANRGIPFTQIMLFNHDNKSTLNWFKEKGMSTFQFMSMGKIL